ncbi:MAG: hypothetical protein DCC68_18765 [Planctomycetota bacterium]|nr:MAG: hypothetical protein DCC68_18765 [Planctomycetota bacterium]
MNGLFAAVALAAGVLAQEAGPQWKSSYADAYHASRNARRPLLVVIEKPGDRHYPVGQASFARAEVSPQEAALLANYELCRIDANTENGQKVATAFGATQFPYVAITDKNVEVLLVQHAGAMSQDEWLATLATHRTGARPEPVVCFT